MDVDSRLYFERKLCGHRDAKGIVQQKEGLQFQYFYVLPKVHKVPWKTRPVVSKVASIQEALNVWIDVQLQEVLYLCPAYLKDSWYFLDRLKTQLANSTIFTADAAGMYSNINTDHALATFVVITGRNTGTGAGIPEKPAETAGVDTAGRYSVCLCAFFARLIKPGRQQENRGAKNHRNVNSTHAHGTHTRVNIY
jgi:hypothetical protein